MPLRRFSVPLSRTGLEGGVLDVLVPQVVLDGAGVLAVVGELEARQWRSMCGWIGMPSLAASPARAMSLRKVAAVIGARRSEVKT